MKGKTRKGVVVTRILIFCILGSINNIHAADIGGKWTMNANGHPAILLITPDGGSGSYEYINWYDCSAGNMANLIVSDTTISWDRECSDSTKNQHYVAELSENLCEMKNGIFTFKGSNYSWSASKDNCVEVLKNLGGSTCESQ